MVCSSAAVDQSQHRLQCQAHREAEANAKPDDTKRSMRRSSVNTSIQFEHSVRSILSSVQGHLEYKLCRFKGVRCSSQHRLQFQLRATSILSSLFKGIWNVYSIAVVVFFPGTHWTMKLWAGSSTFLEVGIQYESSAVLYSAFQWKIPVQSSAVMYCAEPNKNTRHATDG